MSFFLFRLDHSLVFLSLTVLEFEWGEALFHSSFNIFLCTQRNPQKCMNLQKYCENVEGKLFTCACML